MENNKVALGGSALLIFGLFAPIFSVRIGGNLNFISGNPTIVSISILVLGCLCVFACARNEVSKLIWAGTGSFLLLVASFALAQYRFSQIRAEFERQIAGNPFAQSARDSFSSPQLEWGWPILALGSMLVAYSSFRERKALAVPPLRPNDQIERNYALGTAAVTFAGIAMLILAQINSSASAQGKAVDAPAAMAKNDAMEAAADAEAKSVDHEKQDYIAKNLEIYDLDARYMDSLLDGNIPGVTFKLKNKGDQTLNRVEVTIEFLDQSGKPIAEEVYNPVIAGGYDSSPPLRPGYIWQNERDRFLAAKSVPSEWESGKARAKVTNIEFSDSK